MTVYQNKLSKSGFQFTEYLLYNAKTFETAIRELEIELEKVIASMNEKYPIGAANLDGMPHGTGVSSPTESLAIKRADNIQVKCLKNRIEEIQRHKAAIDQSKQYLTDTEKLFIKLKYDREKSSQACWREMHIEKSRWYEMRQEIIHKIARYIGIY